METTNDNELSFDIIKYLPEEICNIIFGNLKSRDLLKASLVSTEWYKFIAKSAVCMQKLKLTFSSKSMRKMTPMMRGIFVNSNRKYENVKFKNSLKFIVMRNILLIRGAKWKKVTMSYLKFPTEVDFINFFAIVEPFVEERKMKKVYIVLNASVNPKKRKLPEQQQKSLTFPNLKFLELTDCEESIIKLFQDVVTLTEFNTKTSPSTTISAIQKIIRRNKGLKKLTTSCIALDQMVRDITCKLVSLQIGDLRGLSDDHKTNFKQFLELHMNTLETLTIEYWIGLETVKMIFHMPKLKHLSLGLLHGSGETLDWKKISFKQSLSLISLHLSDRRLNAEMLQAFLSATPHVKELALFWINDQRIAYISDLLPNLESLLANTFHVRNETNKSLLFVVL